MQVLKLILRQTTTRIGFIVLLILQGIIGWQIGSNLGALTELSQGTGILDFSIGYSYEQVSETFASYGEEGMSLYRRIQFLDIFNPLIYSLILATLFFIIFRDNYSHRIILLAFLPGLLDYLENITLFILSENYPDISRGIVTISSSLSIIKQVALVVCISGLIAGIVLRYRARSS